MKRAVVDASVAVKWVVEEAHSTEAIRAYELFDPIAPALIHAEVASALTKKAAQGELTAEEAVRKMREIVAAGIDVVPDEVLCVEAVRLAARLGHAVYDCFYLTLAGAEGVPLVSADRDLLAAACEAGLSPQALWIGDVE